jgi:hypothetical protein
LQSHCNSLQTLPDPGIDIKINSTKDPSYNNEFIKKTYESDVGSVQFLASQTRPDIAEASELQHQTQLSMLASIQASVKKFARSSRF